MIAIIQEFDHGDRRIILDPLRLQPNSRSTKPEVEKWEEKNEKNGRSSEHHISRKAGECSLWPTLFERKKYVEAISCAHCINFYFLFIVFHPPSESITRMLLHTRLGTLSHYFPNARKNNILSFKWKKKKIFIYIGDLAEIAQELDQQERDMMMEAGLDTSDGEWIVFPFFTCFWLNCCV